MNVDERNEAAKNYVTEKLDYVDSLNEDNFKHLSNYEELATTLTQLIDVKPMGFRGVVATAITGKYLNPNFDPLNNFYSCNPRSIFEKGIFYAFENRVPCGKSDPLNVAKNINVLDNEWANGKRPQSAAQAAVNYLRFIENSSGNEKDDLISFFFYRLLSYAKSVSEIAIVAPTENQAANQIIASKLVKFVLNLPESGTIPQLVVSILLKKVYENSTLNVEGGDESVFGTNTTSKKPADIWIAVNDTPTILYEITVKVIDYKRLDDCIQSINTLNLLDRPVHFICRIPNDISTLSNVNNGSLNYKGKSFNFVDISAFIHSIVALLTSHQINEVLKELQTFMEQVNRPVKTKDGWNEIMSDT